MNQFNSSMSSESEVPMVDAEESSTTLSKKAAKKEAAKQEKLRRRQEAAAAAGVASLAVEEDEGEVANYYGDVPLKEQQSVLNPDAGKWTKAVHGKSWTEIGELTESLKGQEVLIRGRVHTSRAVGGKLAFIVLRDTGFTVQCVATLTPDLVSKKMVKFAQSLNRESFVDIIGTVSVPNVAINGATQQVEIQVSKIYCFSKAAPNLPINIEDAARSELDIEKALQVHLFSLFFTFTSIRQL